MNKSAQIVIVISVILLVILAVLNIVMLSQWQYAVEYVPASRVTNPTNVSDIQISRTGMDAAIGSLIPDFSAILKQRGNDGWELVSTFLELETAYPNFGNEEYHTGIKTNVRPQRLGLIFKRPARTFL